MTMNYEINVQTSSFIPGNKCVAVALRWFILYFSGSKSLCLLLLVAKLKKRGK
jgi:hypothetical protein